MGYVRLIQSGNVTEVYRYERDISLRKRRRSKDSYRKRSSQTHARREDNIRRTRRDFQRIVRSNLTGTENPQLFTFTMHQILSHRTSSRIFSDFIKRLRRLKGAGFRYIGVPEFQKRGAVHWHVMFWDLPEYYACKGAWHKKGNRWVFEHRCEAGRQCERRTRRISRLWLHGFVDGVVTDGSPKLAGYLGKYMSKAMWDIRLGGKRAYNVSRNCLRPMSVASSSEFGISVLDEFVISGDNLLRERSYVTKWMGRVNYQYYRTEHENSQGEVDRTEGGQERGCSGENE